MPRSSDEMPELGKTFLIEFDRGDQAFPILGVHYEPRGSYVESASLSPHPDTSKYPNHVLVSIKPTKWDNRVLWTYRILPGTELDGEAQNANGVLGTISVQDVPVGTGATTGADILESTVAPKDDTTSEKTTRDGALWSNTSGKVLGPMGIPGTSSEAVVAKGSAAIQTGINVENSVSDPQDALRNHEKTVNVPYSTTTINSQEHKDRGFIPAIARTFVDPNSTPPVESHLVHVERRFDTQYRTVQDVATYVNGRALVSKKPSRYGGYDVSTDSYTAPSTTPANSGATVEELRQEREKEARLISTVIATGNTITQRRQWDKRILEAYFDTDYSLVLATDAIPANTSTVLYERLLFDENSKLRVLVKDTYNVPANSYVEYKDTGVVRPTLFRAYYEGIPGVTRDSRQGFSQTVPVRYTTTFSTSASAPSPYQIFENDLLVFNVHIAGLMDAATLTRTVNGVAYTQAIPASSPTLATYNSLVSGAAYHVLGGSCDIEVAKIYRIVTIEAIFT